MIMKQNFSPQSQWQALESAEQNRTIQMPKVISVWVAPIIVCVVAIMLSLVVAALLLGNK
jgi:hypothetical protein